MLRAALRRSHGRYHRIFSTTTQHPRQLPPPILPAFESTLHAFPFDDIQSCEDPLDPLSLDPAPVSSWENAFGVSDDSFETFEEPLAQVPDSFCYTPEEQVAYERQLALEESTIQDAVQRYRKQSALASERGDVVTHRNASNMLHAWFGPLALSVKNAQFASAEARMGTKTTGRKRRDERAAELLNVLSAEAIAVITIHVVLAALMRDANGVPLTRLAMSVANNVRAEVNLKRINALSRQEQKMEKTRCAAASSESSPRKRTRSAQNVLENSMKLAPNKVSAINFAAEKVAVQDALWDQREMAVLGTQLVDLLIRSAVVEDKGKFVPAIKHFKRKRKGQSGEVGMLQLTDAALNAIGDEPGDLFQIALPKQKPMLVRPRPWTSPTNGAYLRCDSQLVRVPAHSSKRLHDALIGADLSQLYDGLNALGEQEWRVNRYVLNNGAKLWNTGGGTAGLVTKTNCMVPEKGEFLEAEKARFESWAEEKSRAAGIIDGDGDAGEGSDNDLQFDEQRAKRRLRTERRKAQKINRELVSMRADTNHRIEQAKQFEKEERIWLPHNVDFRGRAYPLPVHLQHMGCDLTRALLTFARPGVELGARGAYWLKIHLANLLGADKLPFDDRITYAEDALPRAIEVGRDPLLDSNLEWWGSAEDPFQLLAACGELAEAVGRHGGEAALEKFHSTLPISMDGSCNGLQHYAALGRDIAGGVQVNLVPNARPQDVYSGVADLVREKVDRLAADGDELCQVVQGMITRKVVKQTVMTSVYGVTRIGARQQIQNRLAEIEGFPEEKLFPVAMMLATLTLSSLGDIFNGASKTMDWLARSASAIAKEGHEVQWTTPLGLPVIQPYRQGEKIVVKTLMQRVSLNRERGNAPVSSQRQRSAFAPNYIHSLDSAHMLLTAIGCQKAGINFAAVHDSYWTNAACVDRMNNILREEFINLHDRDLLTELREGFLMRYPGVEFDALPPRGNLDLDVVRDSDYFFS